MQLALKLKSKDLLLSERFSIFHLENPKVYETLHRLAREARAQGKTRIGIGMLWEVMRWEMWLKTSGEGEDFKLNNNYRSRYARLIMQCDPELADVFETRKLKSS